MAPPDLNTAIEHHHVILTGWWRTPRYRAAVAKLKEAKPFCERCGKPTTTALHGASDYSKGYEHYVSVVEKMTVPAGCQRCNREERRNRRPCPLCVQAYAKDHTWRIGYIPFDVETCFRHKPKEEQARLIRTAKAKREGRTATARFPCGSRLPGQGCDNEKHIGACDRSAKNAEGCDHFGRRRP